MLEVKNEKYLNSIVYNQIKEMIIRGQIDGPSISENELGKQLGVSRTPIREALQKLQYEKFLQILPKRGIYIREVTIKEASDLMDVRLAIEIHSMNQCLNLFTEEHISILEEKVKVQEEVAEKGDIYGFIKEDIEYHLIFLKIVNNEYFIDMFNNITHRLFHHGMGVFNKDRTRMISSINDHKKINFFLRNNQYEDALKSLEHHILKGKKMQLS